MSPGKKATPGTTVSPAEINDLIVRVRDLRTHLESNRRHLNMIDGRLARVEAELDPLKVAVSVDVHVKETPFLAWGHGEPCPVCGEAPPEDVGVGTDAWQAWVLEHIKAHAEEAEA